jgi:stage II sporulation protein D
MKRRAFIAASAAAIALPMPLGAQEQYDPGVSSATQALRVLLGAGDATASASGGFTLNGKPYRGTFTRLSNGSVINTVPLEEYLYGVVPREMSPSWPDAAMQAQAICARTYVLQRSAPGRAYDLVPSEADQVYGGMSVESPAGRSAVDATAGSVLQFDTKFAQVMYSSCCGGHTEASSDAWGGAVFSYLNGVVCVHCTASPSYRWSHDVSRASVASAFAQEILPYGALQGFYVSASDASGRAKTVELRCEHGSAFVKGATFRSRVGSRVIPSLLITDIGPSATSDDATSIKGGGLGHGVGLCQWGARGMALEGSNSSQILQFYFPGTTIGHD